jgi:hypothetical protein
MCSEGAAASSGKTGNEGQTTLFRFSRTSLGREKTGQQKPYTRKEWPVPYFLPALFLLSVPYFCYFCVSPISVRRPKMRTIAPTAVITRGKINRRNFRSSISPETMGKVTGSQRQTAGRSEATPRSLALSAGLLVVIHPRSQAAKLIHAHAEFSSSPCLQGQRLSSLCEPRRTSCNTSPSGFR